MRLDKRPRPKVVAIKMKQIEPVEEGQIVGRSQMQLLEIGNAVLIAADRFAVDQERSRLELPRGFNDAGIPIDYSNNKWPQLGFK
jgi:hypothetical protein